MDTFPFSIDSQLGVENQLVISLGTLLGTLAQSRAYKLGIRGIAFLAQSLDELH
jgi:hypothetical protein